MRREGFTLIELMVAISILVVIVTIVFVAFASVTDTAAVARENTERMHLQQFLWRHLNTNLSAVYADAGCEEPSFGFASEDEEGPFGPADKLTFCTALPMDGPRALPGVFKVVTYEVADPDMDAEQAATGTVASDENAEQEAPRRVLRITEKPLALSEFTAVQESEEHTEMEELDDTQEYAQVREIPIASFNVTFFDGEEWVDTWDSLSEGIMPWAVRLNANFPRSEEELSADMASGIDFTEESDLDLVIAFPMGAGVESPWVDMNHSRNAGAETLVGPDGQPVDGNTDSDGDGIPDVDETGSGAGGRDTGGKGLGGIGRNSGGGFGGRSGLQ